MVKFKILNDNIYTEGIRVIKGHAFVVVFLCLYYYLDVYDPYKVILLVYLCMKRVHLDTVEPK